MICGLREVGGAKFLPFSSSISLASAIYRHMYVEKRRRMILLGAWHTWQRSCKSAVVSTLVCLESPYADVHLSQNARVTVENYCPGLSLPLESKCHWN